MALKIIPLFTMLASLASATNLSFFALGEGASPPALMSSTVSISNLGEPLLVLTELRDVIRHETDERSTFIGRGGNVEKSEIFKRPSVVIVLPDGFVDKFGKMTAAHIGRHILVVSGETVLVAPMVRVPIYTDRLEISCPSKEAADLLYEKLKPMIQTK